MIIAGIAAGAVTLLVAAISMAWLIDRIKIKMMEKKVKSVLVADMQSIINQCQNTKTLADLNVNRVSAHADLVMCSIDENNKIFDEIESIRDTNSFLDSDVEELLSKDKERAVIIGR